MYEMRVISPSNYTPNPKIMGCFPAPSIGDTHFTIMDYTLGEHLGVEDGNYGAQEHIRRTLQDKEPELAERITFDSEYGCFFAYAKTREDVDALLDIVDEEIRKANPNATPGNITDSPAFFTTEE